MKSDTTRYVVGFLVAVGLIVVVIVLLVRSLVSGPSTSAPAPKTLPNYADTATTVQLTLDSPVVAPARHHDVIINVGRAETILTVTEGYNGDVIRSKTYPMTVTAYRIFLQALYLNGFTQGNADPAQKDESGHCALGDRYIYEIVDPEGQSTQRFWSTTCGTGTFNGNGPVIRNLFHQQVPAYGQLTNDLAF